MYFSVTPARLILSLAATLAAAVSVSAQAGQPPPVGGAQNPPGLVRSLSVDDAVALALEHNLGIQVGRLDPQIQDLAIAQTRASWAPTFTSGLANTSITSPVTNTFAGGQTEVTDSRLVADLGVNQVLPTGANYSVAWTSTRSTTSNFFNNFNPQLRSDLSFNVSQPLLRNFKIDNIRQQLAVNSKLRESSDIELRATITRTVRNVRNAYWDLSAAVANLAAQRQSLALAQRSLADNEKRVQIGTMAPIDIVEAQAEVARNEETVIVAESTIRQAEDRLRTLIFDTAAPDFWTMEIQPSDAPAFEVLPVDVDAAVRHAMENRSDLKQAKNGLERDDVSIRYLRNQILPDINAEASYGVVGVGGSQLQPLTSFPVGGLVPQRTVVSQRSYGAVLADVFGNAFPTWTIGVQIGYPIGTSTSEANLARARLQYTRAQTELRNLELQVVTQVRDVARQVETNQKRVGSARAARELSERRLEAEEKKFAAGLSTTFLVFQAQRDLSQARTAEIRAILDYNKSLVDMEAVQEVPLAGVGGATTTAAIAQAAATAR
jgi:outer membrane protein TolC